MRALTTRDEARFHSLVHAFEGFDPLRQRLALAALRNTKDEAQRAVVTLLELHFSFPPETARCRTGETIGHFILRSRIGGGGMGVVYEATQTFSGSRQGVKRTVVVKLVRPELLTHQSEWAIDRFQTELCNLVQLNHQRIVRLYDAGIYHNAVHCEDVPFLAMEHIAGETLRTYACKGKLLGVQRALELFLAVCDAVAYAHDQNVIHLDLKPENILVDRSGDVHVIDFGLAQIIHSRGDAPKFNILVGTPAYMSPEQVSAYSGLPCAASDIYALGIILHEILTGQRPYDVPYTGTLEQVEAAVLEATPKSLQQGCHECGPALERIVSTATAKRPADRYQNASELGEQIRYVLADIATAFTYLRQLREWAVHLLGVGAVVGMAGNLTQSESLSISSFLIFELIAVFAFLSVFLELSYRMIKPMQPLFNSTFFVSVAVGMFCSLIGGLFYAFGTLVINDQGDPTITPIWHIRLLRFMVTGLVVSFVYGAIFAFAAARREGYRVAGLGGLAVVWILAGVVMGAIIYGGIHLTEVRFLSSFLSELKQGDVRFEVFVLTSGMVIFLMIAFENWRGLTRHLDGGAFMARTLISFMVLLLGCGTIANLFWGVGGSPQLHQVPFAVYGVTLIGIWSIGCYHLFTGTHRFVAPASTSALARHARNWRITTAIVNARIKTRGEWFSR